MGVLSVSYNRKFLDPLRVDLFCLQKEKAMLPLCLAPYHYRAFKIIESMDAAPRSRSSGGIGGASPGGPGGPARRIVNEHRRAA